LSGKNDGHSSRKNIVKEFLLKDRFIEEQQVSNHYFYKKTETGERLHELLKKARIMQALVRVSGKN